MNGTQQMSEEEIKISTGGVVIHNDDDDEFTADRDQVLKRIMSRDVIKHDNSHLGGIDAKSTRVSYWSELYSPMLEERSRPTYYSDFGKKNQAIFKDTIEMVILPSWGVIFPPYNIARLTGLLRHYDYFVNVSDININAYRYFTQQKLTPWWDSNKTHYWCEENYWIHIHNELKPVIDKHIGIIVKRRPSIVGLSLYLTNMQPSLYFIHQLKLKLPNVKIVVGGPGAFNTNVVETEEYRYKEKHNLPKSLRMFDYIVEGEGEQEILSILETYKEDTPQFDNERPVPIVSGGFRSKLDLNELPFPDYSDYDLSWYDYSDGVSIETSRGCVAKCTFCAETHFWRYRWRETNRVVEEMKYQYNRYGTRRFWFVDSLVNGNFKEFDNLVRGIIDSGMSIRWNSYARCDGRMDLDFFKRLKQSGCMSLSFGLESGSQKVLNNMKKNVKIKEMLDNIRDAKLAELNCHGNWIVGFPTEHNIDAAHSLQFLWNIRNDLYAISPGFGCGIAQFSDIQTNGYKNYKIMDTPFEDDWWTEDYRNTILHRALRIKFMAIWFDLIKDQNSFIKNTQSYKNIKNYYNITFDDTSKIKNKVEQLNLNFDYYLNPSNDVEKLKFGLMNEYIAFAWALYSVFGGFDLSMDFNKEKDSPEFGPRLSMDHTSVVNIRVDLHGQMTMNLTHSYQEADTTMWRNQNNQKLHNLSWDTETVVLEKNLNDFLIEK